MDSEVAPNREPAAHTELEIDALRGEVDELRSEVEGLSRGSDRWRRELPLPPPEMRALVGPLDSELVPFDNPTGAPFPYAQEEAQRRVFDFGCGCGRLARLMLQSRTPPAEYLGIDLHRGMVEWCQENLTPRAPTFQFRHHDVFDARFSPDESKPAVAPFPAPDDSFSIVLAGSVFTHLVEEHARHYFDEAARILEPTGVLLTSWFLFDKVDFPILGDDRNALYVSHSYPPAAVAFDRSWVAARAAEAGLSITKVERPFVRGAQWSLLMTPARDGVESKVLPPDDAPYADERTAARFRGET
jgi:SAM-dependent methyltransferase